MAVTRTSEVAVEEWQSLRVDSSTQGKDGSGEALIGKGAEAGDGFAVSGAAVHHACQGVGRGHGDVLVDV